MPKNTLAFWERIAYWGVLVTVTVGLALDFSNEFRLNAPRTGLNMLLDGTAYRPFAYRVLVPVLIRLSMAVLPIGVRGAAALVLWLSLLGFALSFRLLVWTFWNTTTVVTWLVPLFLLVLIPISQYYRYVYDFTTLFLFTLGLTLMARARWKAFLAVYILACLNRETTILLTGVFVSHFFRGMDRRLFVVLTAAQLGLYTAIRLALMWIFRDNPGQVFEYHLPDHMMAAVRWPGAAVLWLAYAGVMAAASFWKWGRKPVFLRQAALVVAPALLVLYWLFGYPGEIRVFYETLPILFLLSAPVFGHWLGIDLLVAQRDEVADSRLAAPRMMSGSE